MVTLGVVLHSLCITDFLVECMYIFWLKRLR